MLATGGARKAYTIVRLQIPHWSMSLCLSTGIATPPRPLSARGRRARKSCMTVSGASRA